MLTIKEPSVVALRDDPFCDKIVSILLRPDAQCVDKQSNIYTGMRFEVTYVVGHTTYYGLVENFELFEQLMRHMVQINKTDKYNDMLVKCYQSKQDGDNLIVDVEYEDETKQEFHFKNYRLSYIFDDKEHHQNQSLMSRAEAYQRGCRLYHQTETGWSKIQPHAM